jgi:uncharacterized protein (TIGR00369 family)
MTDRRGTAGDARLQDVADRMARSTFHRWAGIELIRAEPGKVEIALHADHHHLNLLGTVHGGMLATLADTAMGLAMRTRAEPRSAYVTTQLDLHYLAPGRPGRIVGIGRSVKAGRQMGYAEADVLEEGGGLLARAGATFIVVPEPPDAPEGRPRSSGHAAGDGASSRRGQ